VKIRSALLIVLAVAACSDGPPRKYYSREPFQPADVAWSMASGTNSLTGTAVFKYADNEPRPCADVPVRLVPDSPYARLRLQELYGSDLSGVSSGPGYGLYGPERVDYRWLDTAKTAHCNSQGSFSFEGVPDGVWYVVSAWGAWTDKEGRGAAMFKRVELRGGQAVTINLP
jgi:hypothetical protein